MKDIFEREIEKGDLILEAYDCRLIPLIITKVNPNSLHYLLLYERNVDDLKNNIKNRACYLNINMFSNRRFVKVDKNLLLEDQRKIYEELVKLI